MLDLGALVAGTQYRGDFENRINAIMKGVSKEKMPIIYIDEIHNLVGAGAVGNSSLDASNMLKPYLEAGKYGSSVRRLLMNTSGISKRAAV